MQFPKYAFDSQVPMLIEQRGCLGRAGSGELDELVGGQPVIAFTGVRR
ncbi:hypothetical protein [Streptomyces sp. NPDC004296]